MELIVVCGGMVGLVLLFCTVYWSHKRKMFALQSKREVEVLELGNIYLIESSKIDCEQSLLEGKQTLLLKAAEKELRNAENKEKETTLKGNAMAAAHDVLAYQTGTFWLRPFLCCLINPHSKT